MALVNKIDELIGNTPIMKLNNYMAANSLEANIFAKLEYLNPAGSVKDRVAKNMLDDAEKNGLIKPGATIIEPTSGNTGIGLAAVAASRGYKAILTMPDTMSIERVNLLKAYGAEIVLTEGNKGMAGAISKAEELKSLIPNSFIPGQFTNTANPEAHILSTGPEIWDDMEGNIDIFVAGIGTGGTITGIGKYLKSKNSNIKVVGLEPANSPVITEGRSGAHGLQGIGANFVPKILDLDIVDVVMTGLEEDAYRTAKLLGTTEGLLVGITSGISLWAATELAKREENNGKNIVVLLPDTGDRYLSTPLFQ